MYPRSLLVLLAFVALILSACGITIRPESDVPDAATSTAPTNSVSVNVPTERSQTIGAGEEPIKPSPIASSGQLTAVPGRQCLSKITFEVTVACALQTKSEIASYTFEAKANDVVAVKVKTNLLDFSPSVTLIDAHYQAIGNCFLDTGCTLPADGTYTIQIEVGGLGANYSVK